MKQTSLFKQFFLLILLLVGSTTGALADDIWVKTNFSDLETGDIVVIVDQTTARAMSNDKGTSNAPTAIAVTLNNDKSEITGTVAANIQWTVTKTEGGLQFGVGTKYLYCTNSNNGVRVGTNANNVFSWELSDNEGNSSENFLFNNATSRYLGVYNSSDWRCYTSVNANIKETVTAIYKKTSAVDPTAPSAALSTTSLDFGKVNFGATKELTFTVTPANLTGDLYISCNNAKYEVTPKAIAQATTTAQTITVTAKPTALEDNMDGTVTINGGGLAANKTVTLSTTVTNPNANDGSEEKPFTVAEAIANTPATGTSQNYYIKGIVSAFYGSNTDIVSDANHRYYISDDGSTTNQLLVFKGKGLNNAEFTDADDLLIGDEVTILGGLTTYNSTKEIAADNYITSLNRPVIPTHTATFSVNGVTTSDDYQEGKDIVFPADPNDMCGKVFMGWAANAIDGTTDVAPSFVTEATMGTADVTYYAVFAKRTPGESETTTDVLDNATTGVGNVNTYTSWSGKTETSNAVYAGKSAGDYETIQLRSNYGDCGIITTASGGSRIQKVTVEWNSNTADDRTLDIYGKNTAYTAVTDLYDIDKQGTKLGSIVNGTSTKLTITGDYTYIGLRSKSGAMYLNSITIDWETGTPATYSAYCTTVPAVIDVTAAGWATTTTPNFPVSFDANAEVYIATTVDANITLEKITDAPANTPIVVNAPSGSYTMTQIASASTDVTNNQLKSKAADGITAVDGDYVLGTWIDGGNTVVGFGKLSAAGVANMTDDKAFIPASSLANAVEFLPFVIGDEENEATTIKAVDAAEVSGTAYNLAGQKVSKDYKGIVVVNGKKFVRK